MVGRTKRTLESVSLKNKTVLLRVDFDVPVDKKGRVADAFLLKMSLPTIWYLLEQGSKVVIISHRGNPGGKPAKNLSLAPVAQQLATLLGQPVRFVDACIGDKPRMAVKLSPNKQVIVLENLCFHPGEVANDEQFARQIQQTVGADYLVLDAFLSSGKKQASTQQLPLLVPALPGKLIEKELAAARRIRSRKDGKVVAVLGGSKVSDRVDIIEHLIDRADHIVIGGVLANTFLAYRGIPIGKSKIEPGQEKAIDRIYTKAARKVGITKVNDLIVLPTDVAVALSPKSRSARSETDIAHISDSTMILDLGQNSTRTMIRLVESSDTVIWSGLLGYVENPTFAHATKQLTMALKAAESTFTTITGEGTVQFVLDWDKDFAKRFNHISTGGRSGLLLFSGQPLPGIDYLLDAQPEMRYTKGKKHK